MAMRGERNLNGARLVLHGVRSRNRPSCSTFDFAISAVRISGGWSCWWTQLTRRADNYLCFCDSKGEGGCFDLWRPRWPRDRCILHSKRIHSDYCRVRTTRVQEGTDKHCSSSSEFQNGARFLCPTFSKIIVPPMKKGRSFCYAMPSSTGSVPIQTICSANTKSRSGLHTDHLFPFPWGEEAWILLLLVRNMRAIPLCTQSPRRWHWSTACNLNRGQGFRTGC